MPDLNRAQRLAFGCECGQQIAVYSHSSAPVTVACLRCGASHVADFSQGRVAVQQAKEPRPRPRHLQGSHHTLHPGAWMHDVEYVGPPLQLDDDAWLQALADARSFSRGIAHA